MNDIANHLGWRYSGAATLRLRPLLERLVAADLLTTKEPPGHKKRSQKWTITPAGRRRLPSADPVYLPESPQHRRWRQHRDVAAWAVEGVRADAARAMNEAYDLFTDKRADPLRGADIYRVMRRFETAMKAFAMAIRMSDEWPEPSDECADEHALDYVALLLPDSAKKRRR
jgi:DNA-binding PadR family transcriptional regulator